jgi:hypothetical protein
MEIVLKTGQRYRYNIPGGSFMTPEALDKGLYNGVLGQLQKEFSTYRQQYADFNNQVKMSKDDDGEENKNNATRKRRSASAERQSPNKTKQMRETSETDWRRIPNPRIPETIQLFPEREDIIMARHSKLVQRHNIRGPVLERSQTPTIKAPPKNPVVISLESPKIIVNPPEALSSTKAITAAAANDPVNLRNEEDMRKFRITIAGKFTEIGSKQYRDLIERVDNKDNFYKMLQVITIPDISKERVEFETKIIYAKSVHFKYQSDIGRFTLEIDNDRIKEVLLSDQISYVLGYEDTKTINAGDTARYSCDLRGGYYLLRLAIFNLSLGVSHLCVYINSGLIENIIVGDKMTSLLRIVPVSGAGGDIIEKRYDSPVLSKVVAKEIGEIEVEIRSMEGRAIKFDYGIVIITLMFKRTVFF